MSLFTQTVHAWATLFTDARVTSSDIRTICF